MTIKQLEQEVPGLVPGSKEQALTMLDYSRQTYSQTRQPQRFHFTSDAELLISEKTVSFLKTFSAFSIAVVLRRRAIMWLLDSGDLKVIPVTQLYGKSNT